MNRSLLVILMLAMAGTSGTSKGGNFENNPLLREGAPIGFKNPGQTCWLSSVLTMLFGGQSPLAQALLLLNPTEIDDLFTKALGYQIKDMHNKNKKWLTYKNDQEIPGKFWKELTKKMPGITFDNPGEDIDAFDTLLDAIKKIIPNFDTTFGAPALGKRIGKIFSGYALQPIDTTRISNDTLPGIFETALQEGNMNAQKNIVPPDLLWIRPFVLPTTPLPFALGLDLATQFQSQKQVLYLISGMTIRTGAHYASLIVDKTRKQWYLVNDAVVTTISAEAFAKFARDGVLVTEHRGVNKVYKTEWYPSILQYALRKKPQKEE